MSTGGIEVSFLQLQASIMGFSANRINHTAHVWVEGDAARLISGRSVVKRLVSLVRHFDTDCHSIVVFDSSNTLLGKLVCDAECVKWTLVPGSGLNQIESKIEKRKAYIAACAGEAEDAPESPATASVSLPAGVGWAKSL